MRGMSRWEGPRRTRTAQFQRRRRQKANKKRRFPPINYMTTTDESDSSEDFLNHTACRLKLTAILRRAEAAETRLRGGGAGWAVRRDGGAARVTERAGGARTGASERPGRTGRA